MTNIIKTLAFGAALTVAACGASPAYAEFFDIPKPDTAQRERVAKIYKELFPELPANSKPVMMEHPLQEVKCYRHADLILGKLDEHGYRTQGQSFFGGSPTVLMVNRGGYYIIFSREGNHICVIMEGVIDTLAN